MSQPPFNQVPVKKSNPWPWIVGFGCGIPIVLIGGCFAVVGIAAHRVMNDPGLHKAVNQFQAAAEAASKNTASEKVMLKPGTKVKVGKDDAGNLHVKGTLVNKTDATIPLLIVKVIGNDKSGARVEVGMATTTNLGPHESWSYDVMFTDKEAVKAGAISTSTTPLAE